MEVFSWPFDFSPRALPSFYQSLLLAWCGINGSLSQSQAALVMASSDPHQLALAFAMTDKSAYLFLLLANFAPPPPPGIVKRSSSPSMSHRTGLPLEGSLVSALLIEPSLMWLSRCVAHGVLNTFGYDYDLNCFCGSPEIPSHLFFLLCTGSQRPWLDSICRVSCLVSVSFSVVPSCPFWLLCFLTCCGSCFCLPSESSQVFPVKGAQWLPLLRCPPRGSPSD